MTAPLFRFYVTFRDRAGDHDADPVWAADAEAAIAEARRSANWIERIMGGHACDPDGWDAVRLAHGRVMLRADYEKEMAA